MLCGSAERHDSKTGAAHGSRNYGDQCSEVKQWLVVGQEFTFLEVGRRHHTRTAVSPTTREGRRCRPVGSVMSYHAHATT